MVFGIIDKNLVMVGNLLTVRSVLIHIFWITTVLFLTQSASTQSSYNSPLSLTVSFDMWPEESSWDIRIGDTIIVASADYKNLGDEADNTILTINNIELVPANHYYFNFYDAFIDGMCCIQGSGSFVLKDANDVIVSSGGDFEIRHTTLFNISGDLCTNGLQDNGEEGIDCGGLCTPCTSGCMDDNAHNYNPNATVSDGSCETCDDGIVNGDEVAIDCGGSLCSPCIAGCMDIESHNYNANAKMSDGSCETCSDGLQNGDEQGKDCGGSKCEPCQSDCAKETFSTSSDITSDMSVAVGQTIQAQHKVHSNLTVDFRAGQEIILGAGFEIGTNAVFEAVIGGCGE